MRVIGEGTYPDTYELVDVFSLPIAKVAAGADLSFKVPVGVLWNVVSLTGLFTASAQAATRVMTFAVKDEGGSTMYQYAVGSLTANQTGTFTFSEDCSQVPTFATGGNFLEPFPSTWLQPNWTFGTVTAAIQTSDQWSNVNCWVQAYLPPAGE